MEVAGLELWQVWVFLGLLLATFELVIPGFLVSCFAVGAFASALLAYFHVPLLWQGIAFPVASLLFAFFLRPFAVTFLYKSGENIATNVEALIGKRGIVIEEIPGNMEKGVVKVGGEEWSAISEIDLPIPKGKRVVVKRIEGNKLIVELEE